MAIPHSGSDIAARALPDHAPLCADHIFAPSSTDVATQTVADVCMSLPQARQAVDLSPAQMAGAQSDIDVPARR